MGHSPQKGHYLVHLTNEQEDMSLLNHSFGDGPLVQRLDGCIPMYTSDLLVLPQCMSDVQLIDIFQVYVCIDLRGTANEYVY